EQKLAASALVESEARFRQLSNSMPQIIWTAQPDGTPDYFNDRWYEYTGLDRESFSKDLWLSVLHPDDVTRAETKWRSCVETGELYLIEYRFWENASKTYRWHLGKAVPFYDSQKKITKWFGS